MSIKKPFGDTAAVITAGGSSTRFGGQDKLFAEIFGKPLFILSIVSYLELLDPENIVLTVKKGEEEKFRDALAKYLPGIEIKTVAGGETRAHSVLNGLLAVPQNMKLVAVHDAARPMTTPKLIADCIESARRHGSAVAAKKITDTVKRTDQNSFVSGTVDRNLLWTVETPQVFCLHELIDAYRAAFLKGLLLTDDAGAMEAAGHPVHLFAHNERNGKITFLEDLAVQP